MRRGIFKLVDVWQLQLQSAAGNIPINNEKEVPVCGCEYVSEKECALIAHTRVPDGLLILRYVE